jgi:uncharacterized protein YdhG (YjbR/CyaY superfamily)
MATTAKTTKAPAKKAKSDKVFTDAEMEAMQDAKKERKKGAKADGLADLRAALAKLPAAEKAMGERLHDLVMANAPGLAPKTWYGMPAWADENGKAVCFFTPASKFKERYSSFGFQPNAKLDDGTMWVTSFALLKLEAADEKKLAALIRKAVQ